MTLSKVQTPSSNNGAAATTTVTVTFAATAQGSTLVVFVMCGANGATITPPTSQNWQQVGSSIPTNPAGGTLACFILQNNPGGITGVTFTITSSLASIVGYEVSGQPPLTIGYDVNSAVSQANGTAYAAANNAVKELGEFAIFAVGYINTAALTSTYPSGFTEDVNTLGSAGAANAGLRCASNAFVTTSPIATSGSISGTPTDGPDTFLISLYQYLLEPNSWGPGPAAYALNL